MVTFEQGKNALCLAHLESITSHLRTLLQIFYQNMVDGQVSRSVWLSYIQGFQGWGVGKMVNGSFIKYDGVSGNHVLFFQAMDAFLGLTPYLTVEDRLRYIPVNQRQLCAAFREHSFWTRVDDQKHAEIRDQMVKMIKQVKVSIPFSIHPHSERSRLTMGLRGKALQNRPPNESDALS